MRRGRLAYPITVVVCFPARFQPLAIARPVALQHRLELAPINGTEAVVLTALFPAQLRIGNGQPEKLRLWSRDIDELLTQLIVGKALDLPAHRLRRMFGVAITRSKHHDGRPPPAIERILRHLLLLGRAARQRQHDLEPLALVKALFLADTYHRTRIRTVGTATNRNLIHDRRAVDQPADRTHIRPGQGRVIENARVLRGAREQLFDHLLARDAERLSGTV